MPATMDRPRKCPRPRKQLRKHPPKRPRKWTAIFTLCALLMLILGQAAPAPAETEADAASPQRPPDLDLARRFLEAQQRARQRPRTANPTSPLTADPAPPPSPSQGEPKPEIRNPKLETRSSPPKAQAQRQPAAEGTSAASTRNPKLETRQAPAARPYTVQPGDTFSSIAAEQYGDARYWTVIAQANPLADPVRLRIGQTVRLPDPAAFQRQRDRQLQQVREALRRHDDGHTLLIVQPGDTLSHIARRVYGSSRHWRVIHEANRDKLDRPEALRIGMTLTIPPPPGNEAE